MKRKLYLEGLKQLSLPTVIMLVCGLIMSVINGFNVSDDRLISIAPATIAEVLWQCCVLAYVSPFIFIFYLFRFCYNRKYADLYHASAIKNSVAFFTLTLSAITMSFVIITVCFGVSVAIFPLPLPTDAPLYMYLALIVANLLLTSVSLVGVAVAGKLFSGVCFALFVAFIPSFIGYFVRNRGDSFIYEQNIVTRLINYQLFEDQVFVNQFIPPITLLISLVAALIIGTVAYFVFIKRTAQITGCDFSHPFFRHLSATLLATPFMIQFITNIYDRSLDFQVYSVIDDFMLYVVFFVIFLSYYTICIGSFKKLVGALIPLGLSIALAVIIFIGYKSMPVKSHIKKYELPPKSTVLTKQYNNRFTTCDDELIDTLYAEFEKLSSYEKRMAFEYEWIDDLVIIYSKRFTGGESYVITLTPETFPETYSILNSKE